jgi:hypothetical protein
MSRRQWVRRRVAAALACLGLGFALAVAGSLMAWGEAPLLGYVVGGAGVVLVVAGSLLGRQAIAGPFPPEAS